MNQEQVKLQLTKQEISDYKQYTIIHGYHRLSVNDESMNGSQPFEDPIIHKIKTYPELRTRPKRRLLCNGEIYNYQSLKEQEQFTDKDLQSNSDVEILMPMYIKYGLEETLKRIDGDYSFVLTDNVETFDLKTMQVYVVRDILGVKPMYMIKHVHQLFYMFTSELKGVPKYILEDPNYLVKELPPGTLWSFQNSIINKNPEEFIRYSDWNFYKDVNVCEINTADPEIIADVYRNIRQKVTNAIVSRYTTSHLDVGVLLSGGFDSSVILSVLVNYLNSIGHNFNEKPIYAFTVGDVDSNDVTYAIKVVDYLETKYNIDICHHIVNVNEYSKLMDTFDEIIYNLETYDATTIRGAYAYSLLFKYIQTKTNIRVLLTGEGIDELCGYHQLFQACDETFQEKSVKLLKYLSKFDMLRADKISGSYGLELRHPFIDREFVEYMLLMHPCIKRPQVYEHNKQPIEKYLVRKAFDLADLENTSDDNQVLPYDVLWRPIQDAAECFKLVSQIINGEFENMYTDQDFSDYLNFSHIRLDKNTSPSTKEEMHYRKIFEKYFGTRLNVVPKFWYQLWE
jgi:asparagine synthase (glutamine-hydrolysing)